MGFVTGNVATEIELRPGETGALRLDLAHYAWLDAPGTYRVRLLAPLEPSAEEPPAPSDPRWLTTSVTLVEPTDPAAVVAAHPRALEDQDWTSVMDLDEYGSLGHARYVPLLEPLAARSLHPDRAPPVPGASWGVDWDERAVLGLAACPCAEATAALIRLYDLPAQAGAHAEIAQALADRVPGRYGLPDFVARAWDPSFADPLRERARTALATGGPEAVRWAEQVLDALPSSTDDRALLIGALERTLATGQANFNVVQQLVAEIGTPDPLPAGDVGLVLALGAWDGRTGAPPADWDARLLPALRSSNPAVVAQALRKLGPASSAEVVRAAVRWIGSADFPLGTLARQARLGPNARQPLLDELATASADRQAALLSALSRYLAPDEVLDLVLPRLAANPRDGELAAVLSVGLTGCRSSGTTTRADPEAVTRAVAAWRSVLETRRAELHQGPLPIVPGSTDPALAPQITDCVLASGERWK
jgi:hypothetical protein